MTKKQQKQKITAAAASKAHGVVTLASDSHFSIMLQMLDAFCRDVSILYDERRFWGYEVGAWRPLEDKEIWRQVCKFDGCQTEDERMFKASATACRSIEALTESHVAKPNAFERHRKGIATPSAFWCIEDGEVVQRAHDPAHHSRLFSEVEPDFDESAELWEQSLSEWFEGCDDARERIRFLQEFAGAALFGMATEHACAPILTGRGANGKSVYLRVLMGLFPDTLVSKVPPATLEENRFAISEIAGKALNVATEIPSSELLTSAVVKGIIDGSPCMAERKHQDAFSFSPQAAHIFSANDLPNVRDLSHGFFRRWCIVHFPNVFDLPDVENKGLAVQILDEERSSVLAWAIEGAHRLIRVGRYTVVPSSVEAKTAWRTTSDSVQQWCVEQVLADDEGTPVETLYEDYAEWAKKSGLKGVSKRTFGIRLGHLGYEKKRTKTARLRLCRLRGLYDEG